LELHPCNRFELYWCQAKGKGQI